MDMSVVACSPSTEAIPRQIAETELLSSLWSYWAAKRVGRPMPARSEIVPWEIPGLLPHMTLVERSGDGRFRYRLMGTAVAQARGRDSTGKFFDEVFSGEMLIHANTNCQVVYDAARPALASTTYVSGSGIPYKAARLMLPLASADMQVAMLMIGNVFAVDKESLRTLWNDWTRPAENSVEML